MNKYVNKAMEENSKRFLPDTFLDYTKMHPSEARLVPMAHIKKLRDVYENGKSENLSRLGGESNFVKNPIKWD